MQTTTLYGQDFYAWTQRQIELLQAQQWNQVDIENLIEELDSWRNSVTFVERPTNPDHYRVDG